MSVELDTFLQAVTNRNWNNAFLYCNRLNMYEMLRGLAALKPTDLRDLWAQSAIHAGAVNMPRIEFAYKVVSERKLPLIQPVPSDQIQEARTFLTVNKAPPAGKRKALRLTFFWTKKAQGETVSSALVDKAQELLRNNRDQFTLDVTPVRTILPLDKDISEVGSCSENPQMVEARSLAEKAGLQVADRLPVIFYTGEQVLDHMNQVRDQLQHGCEGGIEVNGKRFVMINTRSVAADKVTLLHEIGHAAKLGHESNKDNFMSWPDPGGKLPRTTVYPLQLNKLGKAYFAVK